MWWNIEKHFDILGKYCHATTFSIFLEILKIIKIFISAGNQKCILMDLSQHVQWFDRDSAEIPAEQYVFGRGRLRPAVFGRTSSAKDVFGQGRRRPVVFGQWSSAGGPWAKFVLGQSFSAGRLRPRSPSAGRFCQGLPRPWFFRPPHHTRPHINQ